MINEVLETSQMPYMPHLAITMKSIQASIQDMEEACIFCALHQSGCAARDYRPQKSNIAFYRAVFSGSDEPKKRDQYRLRTVERVPGPHRGRR